MLWANIIIECIQRKTLLVFWYQKTKECNISQEEIIPLLCSKSANHHQDNQNNLTKLANQDTLQIRECENLQQKTS